MGSTRSPAESPPTRAWQRMLSGRRLDLLNPSPLDIEISDIAQGLSRVARWNGQTIGEHGFSVAQHSLVVERIVRHLDPALSAKDCMVALLHDAPEYVIGDMISPFKAALGLRYKHFEARLEAAINLRFGLPAHPRLHLKALIKRADRACAYLEAVELAGFTKAEALVLFGEPVHGLHHDITPLSANDAHRAYLARFEHLMARAEDGLNDG